MENRRSPSFVRSGGCVTLSAFPRSYPTAHVRLMLWGTLRVVSCSGHGVCTSPPSLQRLDHGCTPELLRQYLDLDRHREVWTPYWEASSLIEIVSSSSTTNSGMYLYCYDQFGPFRSDVENLVIAR